MSDSVSRDSYREPDATPAAGSLLPPPLPGQAPPERPRSQTPPRTVEPTYYEAQAAPGPYHVPPPQTVPFGPPSQPQSYAEQYTAASKLARQHGNGQNMFAQQAYPWQQQQMQQQLPIKSVSFQSGLGYVSGSGAVGVDINAVSQLMVELENSQEQALRKQPDPFTLNREPGT